MKNIKINFGFIFLILAAALCYSCEPRVGMDMDQWGDNAFINNVLLFKLETQDGVKLEEFYEDSTTVTGTRRVIISDPAQIDEEDYSVTVTLDDGETLTGIGLLIQHFGTKVEPLNGAPRAGVPADLTSGPYTYRVYSADGTTHDWTINIEQ